MITFTRNTKHEVELDATSAKSLRNFINALNQTGELRRADIAQNCNTAGVVYFRPDSKCIPLLPPIGTTWHSSK